MRSDLTEIVCVVDKSGSMGGYVDDVIGAFNRFVDDQKALPGEARLTLVLFDSASIIEHCHGQFFYGLKNHSGYQIVCEATDIQHVAPLTRENYRTGGLTALMDAIAITIDGVGERLAKTKEEDRPGKIVFAIFTDGEENDSKKFNVSDVRAKIEHQRDVYKWNFVFLASGEESVLSQAESIGIRLSHALYTGPVSREGLNKGYGRLSVFTSCIRSAEGDGSHITMENSKGDEPEAN